MSPWLALLGIYIVAVFALPTDLGPRALGVVWTPARLMLLCAAGAVILTGRLSLPMLRREPKVVLAGWLLFLTAAALATIVHPSMPGVARLLSLALEGFVLYLVVRAVAIDRSTVDHLVAIVVGITAFVALAALLLGAVGLRYDSVGAVLMGGAVGNNLSGERFGLVRQQGPFSAALFFGIWLATVSALTLPWAACPDRRQRILAVGAWLLLLVAVVVLTVSRVGTTSVLVISGLYFLRRRPRPLGAGLLVVGLLVAAGLAGLSAGSPPHAPPSPPASSPSVAAGATPASSAPTPSMLAQLPGPSYPSESDILAESGDLRVQAVQASVIAIRQEPLFGSGLLTAINVVTAAGGQINYVDSSVLVLAVEIGLVGLAAFGFLVLAIAMTARPALRTDIGLALALAILALLMMSVVAAYLSITQGYVSFSLLAALLVSTSVLERQATPGRAST